MPNWSEKVTHIEGVGEAAAVLHPHWNEIESFFDAENRHFGTLAKTDHTNFGRILKCHLIAEIYVERYLCEKLTLSTISSARLSYFQKVMLLPEHGAPPVIIKPGLLLLNKIRNRFAHNLHANVSVDELQLMTDVLAISNRSTDDLSAVEAIELFATLACTWLLVPPPHLEELFAIAFRNVSVSVIREDE